MIITVDGPAGSGKGTLARHLAAHLGYAHLDTGKLYRAVGLAVLQAGASPDDPEAAIATARALDPCEIGDQALSSDQAAQAASKVAAVPAVRAILLDFQRDFARNPPGQARGAVLDGRDTGTIVCPDAEVKFYVTAAAEIRADRRHRELLARGEPSIYSTALADIRARDRRDMTRAVAPLRPAADAVLIDTSEFDADAVFTTALKSLPAV